MIWSNSVYQYQTQYHTASGQRLSLTKRCKVTSPNLPHFAHYLVYTEDKVTHE